MAEITKEALRDAFKSDFFALCEPWAKNAVIRGLHTIVVDRNEIPAYARREVSAAIRHVESVNFRQNKLLEKAEPPRPKHKKRNVRGKKNKTKVEPAAQSAGGKKKGK